jgi:hypothetical protein
VGLAVFVPHAHENSACDMVHHAAGVDWVFLNEDGDVVPASGLAHVLYRVDLVGHVEGLLLDTLVFGHRSSSSKL